PRRRRAPADPGGRGGRTPGPGRRASGVGPRRRRPPVARRRRSWPCPPARQCGSVSDLTVRERILEATYASVARYGIAKTTVEDVARLARLSRATVYRHFAGGKDELVRETIAWETGRFFGRLAEAVAGAGDFT